MKRDPFNYDANRVSHPTSEHLMKSYYQHGADQLEKAQDSDRIVPTFENNTINQHKAAISANIANSFNPLRDFDGI